MSYCNWSKGSLLLSEYHDKEWGVPVHDDRKQFEFLMLEAMQCGLSWALILKKRQVFHECFDGFNFDKIARYTEEDIKRIMNTQGMLRAERKIKAVINNARCFLDIRKEFGSFSEYIWGFTEGKTLLYDKHCDGFIPASNGLSDVVAADLKRRGFMYLGSITVYSHLQACGMINDHGKDCPCYQRINSSYPTLLKKPYLENKVNRYE